MYLVIKNGNTKKSYQCTNTCNKPRVCVGNSYIPLTNNIQSKPKCKINSMEVASYKSYTYTGEQGTVTTGTTYLTRTETTGTTYQTRASTSSTVYGTKQSILSSDIKRVYTTTSAYVLCTLTWGHSGPPDSSDMPKESTYSKYDIDTVGGAYAISYISTVNGHCKFAYYTGPVKGTLYTSAYRNSIAVCLSGSLTHNLNVVSSSASGAGFNDVTHPYLYCTLSTVYASTVATTGTSYQTRVSTYNTLYGTRASTSGTSYGTKTTNKTLTSSSWG